MIGRLMRRGDACLTANRRGIFISHPHAIALNTRRTQKTTVKPVPNRWLQAPRMLFQQLRGFLKRGTGWHHHHMRFIMRAFLRPHMRRLTIRRITGMLQIKRLLRIFPAARLQRRYRHDPQRTIGMHDLAFLAIEKCGKRPSRRFSKGLRNPNELTRFCIAQMPNKFPRIGRIKCRMRHQQSVRRKRNRRRWRHALRKNTDVANGLERSRVTQQRTAMPFNDHPLPARINKHAAHRSTFQWKKHRLDRESFGAPPRDRVPFVR